MSALKKGKRPQEEEDVEEAEDEENDMVQDEMEDKLEAAAMARGNQVWQQGGPAKDAALRMLIQCFGSMVESVPNEDAIPDHRGRYRPEDMSHKKLLDSSKQVVKAKRILLQNENFDSRDFTIFIAKKKWAKSILSPLLALCEREDSTLAMNVCSLCMVLIKKISEKTTKSVMKAAKRSKAKANKDGKLLDSDSEVEGGSIENFREQLASLMSFKEAMCTEKCNLAITNAFREFWMKEQEDKNEDHKMGMAICFSYFRRILAIAPHPEYSSANEIVNSKLIHDRYVVQLRVLLSLLPAIISDLRNSYHDNWLGDIVLIIFYLLQSFEPADMYLVWKTHGLMENFAKLMDEEDEDEAEVLASDAKKSNAKSSGMNAEVKVPEALKNEMKSSAAGKGLLSQRLQQERSQRLTSLASNSNRFGRFSSTYRIALPQNSSEALDDVDSTQVDAAGKPVNKLAPQTAMLIHNPFKTSAESMPQAKTKRNKKNLTFKQCNPLVISALTQAKITGESQQACVVVSSLVELLTDEACLKSFVRRVNEDLRRDEMRISNEMELQYFGILTKLLAYNRLKVEDQAKAFQMRKAEAEASNTVFTEKWEPNFINIIDTLDRMSFTRVTFAIERLLKAADVNAEQIVYPMALYVEMISYLRLLMESEVEGHHEIAIGALYRLFYASSERIDPLAKLLSSWKPGLFSRKHVNVLIECVHQTMLTLEAARQSFHSKGVSSEEGVLNMKKGKKGKKELDMETYLMASWRFKAEDYFRRLVSNQTMQMYVKVLSQAEHNDVLVNQRIYSFLQRCCSFSLEETNHYPKTNTAYDLITKQAHLGYMLFHLPYLIVIHQILQNEYLVKQEVNQPLIRLLRSIVRQFATIAEHNHMLFVEALFFHNPAHEHCCQLNSVYDAALYAVGAKHREQEGRHSAAGAGEDSLSEDDALSAASSSSEDDYGDEFDENNVTDALKGVTKEDILKKKRLEKKLKKQEQRKAQKKDRSKKKKAHSGDGSDSDVASDAAVGNDKVAVSGRESKERSSKKKSVWSEEEDRALRKLYRQYAGTKSVFTAIANSDELNGLGNHRSELQIERRVMELNLYMNLDDDEDDDLVGTQQQGGVLSSPAEKGTLDLSIFDSGGSAGDIFEERNHAQERQLKDMYGVQMDSDDDVNERSVLAKRSQPGKLSLKKRKKLRTNESISDEDDDLLVGEEGSNAPATITTATTSKLRKAFDSDDDE